MTDDLANPVAWHQSVHHRKTPASERCLQMKVYVGAGYLAFDNSFSLFDNSDNNTLCESHINCLIALLSIINCCIFIFCLFECHFVVLKGQ